MMNDQLYNDEIMIKSESPSWALNNWDLFRHFDFVIRI